MALLKEEAVDTEMMRILVEKEPRIIVVISEVLSIRTRLDGEITFSVLKFLCENGVIQRKSFQAEEQRVVSIIGQEDTTELLNILISREPPRKKGMYKINFRLPLRVGKKDGS